METVQHRKPKTNTKKVVKYLVGLVLLVLIVGGGSFGAMYLMEHGFGGKKSNTEDQTSEQTDTGDSKNSDNTDSKKSEDSKKSDEADTKKAEEENTKKPKEYEGQDVNTYTDLTGYMINAAIDNQRISIRAAINQAVSGECTFNVTDPSGKTTTGTSKIEQGPTSSFCSIEDLVLGKIEYGVYKIEIIPKSTDKAGKITGEVTIK